MKLYVASPLGFSEAGRDFYYGRLVPLLSSRGFEVLDPWSLTDATRIAAASALPYGTARRNAWAALSAEIGSNNFEAIRRCDVLFAVLDGADVDSGTAAEIGCAFALGKRIVGYRGDFRLAGDNDGSIINLQVEYFIRASGGAIVTAFDAIADALVF